MEYTPPGIRKPPLAGLILKIMFTRNPAIRLFAAELADSKQTIIEHVEGQDFDSSYQLTPTGIKVKRVLMMGALVEVDNVGTAGDYLRCRIVDPTGAFMVYAGQYEPGALLSLSGLTIPCFVAIVGKTNAYRPDEEKTIVSIRLETIVEIDARTRDHWIIETAAKTLERVERSHLQESEKEKFRNMCKDALTKLVYMPQEIGPQETGLQETQDKTPNKSTPDSEEDISAGPTIEQSASTEEQPKPEPVHSQKSKEPKTKRNNSIKKPIKKKKNEREAVNNQRTLFTA